MKHLFDCHQMNRQVFFVLCFGLICGCQTSSLDYTAKLHRAVMTNKVNAVKRYIKKGGSVNYREGARGWTPLLFATESGHTDIAKILIENGADVNMASSEDKVSPLQRAASKGNVDLVSHYLDKGAEIDYQDYRLRSTALMWAAANGHDKVASVLLEQGALINVRGNRGESALLLAVSAQNVDLVKLLLSFNAIIDRPDVYGITPLQKAKQLKNKELIDLLEPTRL